MMGMIKRIYIIVFFFICGFLYAQEKEVIEQLKNIEKGNIEDAVSSLPALKNKYPNNPSIIFLEAVLKPGGEDALQLYKTVYEKYPKNYFADAALYRIFSYYYSLGLYKKAEETLTKLKTEYPNSPYIQTADRTIPEELPEETSKESAPVKQAPVKQQQGKFTVQAGAFLNVQNAQSLMKNLESDGYPCEMTTKEVGGSILNVLLAGKFETEKNAETLVTHLDKKYRLKGRIVPTTK
jgi:tetratricopeptide (TPR) repeat protein